MSWLSVRTSWTSLDSDSFLSDCLKSFYKEKSDIQMQTYRELNERYTSALVKSIEESETMSLLSVGIRISLRQLNMIPNTDSYGWWYSVNSFTEEDVNMSFQAKIDNDRVFELLKTAVPDDYRQCRQDGFNYIVNEQPEVATFLSTISQPYLTAYRNWSKSSQSPIPSDHRIFDEAFMNAPGVDKEIIKDLIQAVLLDEMDEDKKKNIVASAYFIIGEHSKAVKILSDEN